MGFCGDTEMAPELLTSITALADILQSRGLRVVTAESCTGGFVTDSNEAKIRYLNVPPGIIEQHGAVSEATVRAMVTGAVNNSLGDVAVAVSGIAGPGGGSPEKPVGTVWFAWGNAEHQLVECCHFPGNRQQVRALAVAHGIQGVCRFLAN